MCPLLLSFSRFASFDSLHEHKLLTPNINYTPQGAFLSSALRTSTGLPTDILLSYNTAESVTSSTLARSLSARVSKQITHRTLRTTSTMPTATNFMTTKCQGPSQPYVVGQELTYRRIPQPWFANKRTSHIVLRIIKLLPTWNSACTMAVQAVHPGNGKPGGAPGVLKLFDWRFAPGTTPRHGLKRTRSSRPT